MTAKLYGGYSTYGEVIGILELETVEPKVPGDSRINKILGMNR